MVVSVQALTHAAKPLDDFQFGDRVKNLTK